MNKFLLLVLFFVFFELFKATSQRRRRPPVEFWHKRPVKVLSEWTSQLTVRGVQYMVCQINFIN